MLGRDPHSNPFQVEYDVAAIFNVTFGSHRNMNVFCPFHEDTNSKTPSCSVSDTGLFSCKACGAHGTAVEFYKKKHGLMSSEEAHRQMCTLHPAKKKAGTRTTTATKRPLGMDAVYRCSDSLRSSGFLRYLKEERGLTDDTIRERLLGCDEWRITIPIFVSTELYNIRRYLPNAAEVGMPKMVSHSKGNGTPVLYPEHVLERLQEGDELLICEGEFDEMVTAQQGFNVITTTGSATHWNPEWTERLKKYRVRFIYDVNDKEDATGLANVGQRMAQARADEFRRAGCADVAVVVLPLDIVGGDLTDWFVKLGKTAQELRDLIDNTPQWRTEVPSVETTKPVSVSMSQTPPEFVTLHEATDARYYFKPIRLRALLAGKTSPYLIPRIIKVDAWNKEGVREVYTKEVSAWDGQILAMVDCTKAALKREIRLMCGIDPEAAMTVDVQQSMNVIRVFLIPAVDGDTDQGPYVMREAFYVGRDLEANKVYDFTGYTLPDPSTQTATHLLVEAKSAETDIDNFSLTPEAYTTLRNTFQTSDPYAKMRDIAEAFSRNVTRIYGRTDLHAAVDLVYHSPLSFNFGGVRVRKGWIEALILGDTRTGKGFVTEGLARHYGMGEVISGENLTMAGLVGGVQHLGDQWKLIWGKLALSDRRLVVMDECNSLSYTDIGRMSRIRSEGIAEITKVISEKTTARTRIIWIANPRPMPGVGPRTINSFNYGIEAVPELVGAAEDVARFDFALIVAQNEVPSAVINSHHSPSTEFIYTAQACRDLIMWAWSRTPEQIVFEEGVADLALHAARDLGRKFSPRIPLIQAEDVRFKLARIAAAVAARVFSTDDGVTLRVRKEHMEYAYNFLHHIYGKDSCGYRTMSTAEREREVLNNEEAVRNALARTAIDLLPDLVAGLLEHRIITARDICDYAGIDIIAARTLISELVRNRAIIKEYAGYTKKPAFKTFLLRLKAEHARETPTTSHDEEPTNDYATDAPDTSQYPGDADEASTPGA